MKFHILCLILWAITCCWKTHSIHLSTKARDSVEHILPSQSINDDANLIERKKTPQNKGLQNFSADELEASDKLAEKMSAEVLKMMHHAWDGYKKTSWGRDEACPISGSKGRNWLDMGATIVDAFSTLWLMSLKDKSFKAEIDLASEWIEKNLEFNQTSHDVSFFETTIRILGGLNAAHAFAGRQSFLDKSSELGTRLLMAFGSRPYKLKDALRTIRLDENRPGLPQSDIDLRSGYKHIHSWAGGICLAEAGSHQLEFRYLTQQTGEYRFAQRSDHAMQSIFRASGDHGLVPNTLDGSSFRFTSSYYTMGGSADSYFEYLLKVWIQGGKVDAEHIKRWKLTVQEMIDMLIRKDSKGHTYLGMSNDDSMEHLSCFAPGMLIYGVNQLPPGEAPQEWTTLAAELADTCHEMYVMSPAGLGAESYRFDLDDGMAIQNAQMILRPEAIESWYYMWYYTGDPKYRKWAADAVKSYNKYAKVAYGYAAIRDVRRPEMTILDSTESFFFAETLKYLFLIFQKKDFFNLDEWVLNTEAHPIRVVKPEVSEDPSTGKSRLVQKRRHRRR